MLLPLVLLAIALAGMALVARRDREGYRRFKQIEDTAVRQRVFRRWIAMSFALHVGYTVLSLALLGQLAALTALPDAFFPAWLWLGGASGSAGDSLQSFATGGAIGAVIAIPIALVIRRYRKPGGQPRRAGDITALMPRNRAELEYVAVLSVNAGIAEELFYRLTLPLLFVLVIGNVWIAFALATFAFGLVHLYQGWIGVVFTTLFGAALAIMYLASGSLWIVVALHTALDLGVLVVRPLLTGALSGARSAA